MKFAVHKAPIMPEAGAFLAGSEARTEPYDVVRDPLYVRTVVLQADKTLVLLAFDLLGGDRSFAASLKRMIRERFGLQPDEVILNFSHTHNSVYASGVEPAPDLRRGYYSIGCGHVENRHGADYAADERYYRIVEEAVSASIRLCLGQLQEGTLELACGKTALGISRRLPEEVGVRFAPNPQADIDRDLHLLRLRDWSGQCRALLFSCACHPTTLSAYNEVSADYPGQACAALEQRHPGVTAVFLQGCCAEIRPAATAKDGHFVAQTYADMVRIGASLADEVEGLLEQGGFRAIAAGRFRSGLGELELAVNELPMSRLEELANGEGPSYRRHARRVMRLLEEGGAEHSLPFYMAMWQLDERTVLVALESEIPTGYSLRIKRELFPTADAIVLGYSNGMFTYIPTRAIAEEGGYEAEAYLYHGFCGPFAPENEDAIISRLDSLRQELDGVS